MPVCTTATVSRHRGSDNAQSDFIGGEGRERDADEEMMGKYGISTDVFETYVADFHGHDCRLFEKQLLDQETNKAVCYDCHGVENILRPAMKFSR